MRIIYAVLSSAEVLKFCNRTFTTWILKVLLCVVCLTFFSGVAFGWTPPQESPLALGLHPRLFFIPESYSDSHPNAVGITVRDMKAKLTTYYRSEFQKLINEMDTNYGAAIPGKSKLYLTNDGIGFAFLYMMDPKNITGFTAAFTKSQYGDKAKAHLIQLATNVRDETDDPDTLTAWLDTRYLYSNSSDEGGPVNLALAVIYDWLGPDYFSTSEKNLLLDAMENAYNKTKDALSGKAPYLNNVATGMIHNGTYPAVAMYGDLTDSRLTTVFNSIDDTCLKAVRDMGNHIFDNSCGWAEGITLYWYESAVHVALLYGGLSSAIAEDLFDTTKFLKDSSYFSFFSTLPFPVDGDYHWLKFDDDDPDYQWDVIDVTVRKTFYILTGMINYTNPDLAGLAKWMYNDSGWSNSPSLDVRTEYVLFNFLGGMNHVVSKTPSAASVPTSRKNGEQYSFKSALTGDSASLVTFWAQEYFILPGGHNHRDFGSFQIHKYGDLAIQRSIAKAFSGGNIGTSKHNMFFNTIGVYKPGETIRGYNLMAYRSGGFDESDILPTASAYGPNGSNHIGVVIGDDLEGNNYDYVDYDYSNSWSDTKVDYAERELVYLRSQGQLNDEYVVVFDRINSPDPTNTKFWLLHASFEPKLLANDGSEINMTPQDHPRDPDSKGGRWISVISSPEADNTIQIINNYGNAHGKLYNKTLLPDSLQINKVGGFNHYWEDAESKLIYTKTLSEEEKYYRGTYTMQVQSKTNLKYDIFLNVMQFGDSNTLTQMSQVDKITATGSNGNMVGALIKDSTKNRVVLFNESKRATVDKVEAEISYTVTTTTASSYHLLTNIKTNLEYKVRRSGTEIGKVVSSNAGTLAFSDSVSPGQYTYSIIEANGASTYYIDQTGGSDSTDGASPTRAWKTLSNVNGKAFAPGDTILLQRGKSWDDALTIGADGTASSPITIGAYGTGDKPVIEGLTIDEGDYIVVEDITVDGKKSDSDAVRVRGSQGSVLRRLTIRNGTKDGLDIARAVDLLVDSCLIHHFLAGSYGVQQDAHGIVVGKSQQITIRNTEVHHVSGDSLQADPDRNPENLTNDILIEDSHFWTGPLTEDFNEGWLRGQNPGENAIDTKVLTSGWESVPRMSITIRNLVAHGWEKDDFVENRAVFNLKEKIEADLDGIIVYDSEIGFRVRGTRGNANVTIKNAVIYSCERAIRAEDDLENLKVYNSTFGDSIDTQLQFAGGSGGTGSWDFRNNAFVDRKPNIASEQSNVVILDGELSSNFVDTGSGDYRLHTGSSLVEAGETLANVTTDRDGKIRTPAYDVGAYEFSTDSDPSGTPAPPMDLRIIQ